MVTSAGLSLHSYLLQRSLPGTSLLSLARREGLLEAADLLLLLLPPTATVEAEAEAPTPSTNYIYGSMVGGLAGVQY